MKLHFFFFICCHRMAPHKHKNIFTLTCCRYLSGPLYVNSIILPVTSDTNYIRIASMIYCALEIYYCTLILSGKIWTDFVLCRNLLYLQHFSLLLSAISHAAFHYFQEILLSFLLKISEVLIRMIIVRAVNSKTIYALNLQPCDTRLQPLC
jgi:hypothetical protein